MTLSNIDCRVPVGCRHCWVRKASWECTSKSAWVNNICLNTHHIRLPFRVVTNGVNYMGNLKISDWSAGQKGSLVAGDKAMPKPLLFFGFQACLSNTGRRAERALYRAENLRIDVRIRR